MGHRLSIARLADESLTTLAKQLAKFERSIARERPDIANRSWDLGVKDGKIVVTGDDLSGDDKEWLQQRITDSSKLSDAVALGLSCLTCRLGADGSHRSSRRRAQAAHRLTLAPSQCCRSTGLLDERAASAPGCTAGRHLTISHPPAGGPCTVLPWQAPASIRAVSPLP